MRDNLRDKKSRRSMKGFTLVELLVVVDNARTHLHTAGPVVAL